MRHPAKVLIPLGVRRFESSPLRQLLALFLRQCKCAGPYKDSLGSWPSGKSLIRILGRMGLESPVGTVVMNIVFTPLFAGIAQLVELLICNQWVGSSSLSVSSIGLGSSLQLPQGVKSLQRRNGYYQLVVARYLMMPYIGAVHRYRYVPLAQLDKACGYVAKLNFVL